ncbi:MAG TPA: hypothetical protein VEC02_08005 [Nitrososphaerales archaeon]|nr:hypothetical protein [Nitrososphaerales archaeon]
MADSDSKRGSGRDDGIISLNTRIQIEERQHPAWKLRMKKRWSGFAVVVAFEILVIALVNFNIAPVTTRLLLPVLVAWVILGWLWERPQSKELQAWKKKRLTELQSPER